MLKLLKLLIGPIDKEFGGLHIWNLKVRIYTVDYANMITYQCSTIENYEPNAKLSCHRFVACVHYSYMFISSNFHSIPIFFRLSLIPMDIFQSHFQSNFKSYNNSTSPISTSLITYMYVENYDTISAKYSSLYITINYMSWHPSYCSVALMSLVPVAKISSVCLYCSAL